MSSFIASRCSSSSCPLVPFSWCRSVSSTRSAFRTVVTRWGSEGQPLRVLLQQVRPLLLLHPRHVVECHLAVVIVSVPARPQVSVSSERQHTGLIGAASW